MKRLAYITSMATGGLARFNYEELIELQRLGVDIGLFISKYKPGPYMPPPGVPVKRVRPVETFAAQPGKLLFSPKTYCGLLAEAVVTGTVVDFLIAQSWALSMKAQKREWIHCHWGDHKLYIGYYCHRLTGLPLSVTLHGYDLYANPNWAMLEKALEACAQIITISDYNKKLLIKRFGSLGERVKVIRLFSETVDHSQLLNGHTKVLIVGGFHPRKGYDVLLKALKQLDREDIRVWIAGYKGPVDVPALVNELGLADRVTIFGHVSDEVLKLLYTYCDIFCLPSRMGDDGVGEGLPVSLMEAMAYEKPIVSTYHTAIPELVPDILVAENDVNGLAQGLARLVDNPDLRRKMGLRNRQIVFDQYSRGNVRTFLSALRVE